jgi:hypothetical protein
MQNEEPTMTEAAQETPKPKRKSRAKDNSVAIMKELAGLMGQRTTLMNQIRAKRAELAGLESSLQELATEIQWRAGVFGLATQGGNGAPPPQPPAYSSGGPQPVPGVIFAQPPQSPANPSGINRGFADLSGLT